MKKLITIFVVLCFVACTAFANTGKDGNLPTGQTSAAQVTNPSQQRMKVLSDKKLCTMKAGAIRESFKVSPDLSKVAYVAGEHGKQYVIINDDENQKFEGIGGLILSPDGSRIVYGAHSDKGWHVVLDGKASEQFYDAVGGFTFSPDSRRLAYIALKQGKTVVIVDGRELDSCRVVRQPVFSPDSKQVAYIAIDEEGKHFVGVDGRRGKGYSAIGGDTPKFSPHGSRLAYIAVENNKFFVVVDGEDGERFDEIVTSFGEFIWFTSDGKHFAYVGKNNVGGKEESYLMLDNKVQSRYKAIYCCTFSPRDDRLAYAGKTKDGVYLILDGNRSDLKFDDILRIQWKPDGSGIALIAQSNRKQRVVINKEEQRDYDSIYDNRVVFSQNGKRYAYVGVRGKSCHIVVDGKETGAYPGLGAPVSFSNDGKNFAYGALINYDMERAQALEIMRLAGIGDWEKIIGRGEQKMVLIINNTKGAVHDGFLTAGNAIPTWNNDNALRYLYISQQVNIHSTLVRLE